MSPKVPQAYLEARRQEIIQAAIECSLEKGFHNVTMQDIYQATSLSPGAVYNYFSGKEEIFAEAARASQGRNERIFDESMERNPAEALSEVGNIYRETIGKTDLRKVTSLNLSLYSEVVRNPTIAEPTQESYRELVTRFVEIVKTYQDRGRFSRELDPQAISQMLVALLMGAGVQNVFDPDIDLYAYFQVFEAIVSGTFSQRGDK